MSSSEAEETPVSGARRQHTRSVSPLVYELFVLGEVMVQPLYGYLLREIADHILGPLQPLSWGVLYPLIRRLEREGLIMSTTEPPRMSEAHAERGQPRRVYAITPAGRERFLALMLAPGAYDRDAPKQFLIKLTKFQFLTPTERVSVLQWYRGYLSDQHAFYQTSRDDVLRNPEITAEERVWILRSIDYQLHRFTAELAWIDDLIALCQVEATPAEQR
jgi:DNA-binding PadR family transcriptional regulator